MRSLFMWIWEGHGGHKKFIPVWIKWTRWRPKIQRDFSAEIRNSNVFSGRKQVVTKKKRSSFQKCHEIRCQFTKIPVANTNLSLDLHSSSPKPVTFFGAQSSLGGSQPRNTPPWRRAWNQLTLLENMQITSVRKKFWKISSKKSQLHYLKLFGEQLNQNHSVGMRSRAVVEWILNKCQQTENTKGLIFKNRMEQHTWFQIKQKETITYKLEIAIINQYRYSYT